VQSASESSYYFKEHIMNALIGAVRQFVRDEEGITAIEYGLIAALMAAALGTLFATLNGGLTSAFASIVNQLNGA